MRVAKPVRGCTICLLPDELRGATNERIWTDGKRRAGYRVAAVRYLAEHGQRLEEKSVTRHADHIERTWREPTPAAPALPEEAPLYPIDYGSVTDAAATLGQKAMARLHSRIPVMEDKDLIATAKLGVSATQSKAALAMKRAELNLTAQAIFGLSSGHVEVPEAEIVDVTPVAALKSEIAEERRQLLIAAGHDG